MHFATRVRTWHVPPLYSVLCSEIAVSRKPFGIGYMCIYNFLLRMTDIVNFQNIEFSSWDILYTFPLSLLLHFLPTRDVNVKFCSQIRREEISR
jgi:hypothetical protein